MFVSITFYSINHMDIDIKGMGVLSHLILPINESVVCCNFCLAPLWPFHRRLKFGPSIILKDLDNNNFLWSFLMTAEWRVRVGQ